MFALENWIWYAVCRVVSCDCLSSHDTFAINIYLMWHFICCVCARFRMVNSTPTYNATLWIWINVCDLEKSGAASGTARNRIKYREHFIWANSANCPSVNCVVAFANTAQHNTQHRQAICFFKHISLRIKFSNLKSARNVECRQWWASAKLQIQYTHHTHTHTAVRHICICVSFLICCLMCTCAHRTSLDTRDI